MSKKRNRFKYWKKRTSHGMVYTLLSICLLLMLLSQAVLMYNRLQIRWYGQQITNITTDSDSDLIIATDAEKSKAGAMDYQGETVIPFANSVFDPWTGELISQGLYHEGGLYWVNQNGKVGIVNAENKVLIPQEYGYLKRGLENQFIAGSGTLSEAAEGGGQYIHKKYGVVAEGNQVIIPLQYDEMSVSDDGTYFGIIYEDTRTIRRNLKTDGTVKIEMAEEVESEQEPERDSKMPSGENDQPETDGEAGAKVGGEASDIQDYEGEEASLIVSEQYNDKKERSIHYREGITTLELLDRSTVLAEFPGERMPGVNEPVFSEDEKLVLDEWEGSYAVYSAKDGQLLCSVVAETDYVYAETLVAYLQEGMYEVKNLKNQILFSVEAGSQDQFMNSVLEKPRFVFQEEYFVYQGDTGRILITNSGVVIAKDLDAIYYNDESQREEANDAKIFVCEKDGRFGAFSFAGEKILDFLYQNVEFFYGHVQALRITDEKGNVGVIDYHGNLIIPVEYDNVGYGANIQGANSRLVETYTLLYGTEQSNRYFGQKGKEIYYLDEQGKVLDRVRYVVKQEQSGGGLSDVLAFKEQMENRVVYRTTGSQKVMSNAFGTGFMYRRCQIETRITNRGITFLCIDTLGNQIGIYDYTYGSFSLMGYQQNLYDIWLVSSRLFLVFFFFLLVSGFSYREAWWKCKGMLLEWGLGHGKQK